MENTYRDIWAKVLSNIKENITQTSYSTWFLPASIHRIDDELKIVYIQSEKSFNVNILNGRYKKLLEDSVEVVLGSSYRVITKETSEYEKEGESLRSVPEPPAQTRLKNKDLITSGLNKQKLFNPRYTFDNFVVGNSNKYAQTAAMAVAESPSQAYNPLFIYGGSGLGKTHLMHAIGIYLLEHNPDLNVLYVSSEMFTNELIKALGDNKTREFKNKYRKVDVLLIDDIQFLEGKETTQEEFFYTFNTLYDLNKQIVISSDRPPNELVRLEDRLRSRFAWNLIASLSPADYETRVAILMKKAQNNKLEVTDDIYDVICLIAEKITDNIRELEGAFNRIISFSSLMHEKIDRNFAKRILKDIVVNGGDSVTPEKIKTVVSRHYNITVKDMESSTRQQTIAYPRQIAMYLCREMTDYSFEKIGNLFGNRHYSTVMHACEKVQKDMAKDDALKHDIDQLKAKIEN